MSELRPRAPADKKRAATTYEIEKGLRESLASTDDGLKKFLASLREAGMHEAAHAYRGMQMVLVQQRLWADAHHRAELLPLFRSIAETAGELHRIFASFADVMRPLKELDKLGAPTAGTTQEQGGAPSDG